MDQPFDGMPESFDAVARTIHTDLGGRADLQSVVDVIKSDHPGLCMKSDGDLRRQVRSSLTEHDAEGKPFAASVGEGTYVQRQLFTVDDYGHVIPRYIDQSVDLLHTAQRLSDECHQKFGVRYFVPGLDSGGQGAA